MKVSWLSKPASRSTAVGTFNWVTCTARLLWWKKKVNGITFQNGFSPMTTMVEYLTYAYGRCSWNITDTTIGHVRTQYYNVRTIVPNMYKRGRICLHFEKRFLLVPLHRCVVSYFIVIVLYFSPDSRKRARPE